MRQKLAKQLSGYAWTFIATLLIAFNVVILSPAVNADEVFAVVRKGTPVTNPMRPYQLTNIFGMSQRTWSDNSTIKVFVLPEENPLSSIFCKQTLNILPLSLRSKWNRQVYSGTGQAPEELNSVDEMKARIVNTPGAIGYLPKEMIDDKLAIIHTE